MLFKSIVFKDDSAIIEEIFQHAATAVHILYLACLSLSFPTTPPADTKVLCYDISTVLQLSVLFCG